MSPRRLILASLLLAACNHEVRYTSEAPGGDPCGPRPPSSGWCPPAWTCVDGEWIDAAGRCPDPACPDSSPAERSACDLVSQRCTYDEWVEVPCDGPWEEQVTYECTTDGWSAITPRCQPPIECPTEPLVAGQDCSGWDYAYFCDYEVPTSCGPATMTASCDWVDGAQVWNVMSFEEPETCPAGCSAHETAAGCEASSECRWLTPGCDDGPSVEGCFPVDACVPGSCADGASCATVTHDPCPFGSCNACAAETAVCL